jgi:ferredoxin-NADP reductase
MVKYLLDTGEKRDIYILYAAATKDRLVYRDVFDEARRRLGANTIYLTGAITPDVIKREIPDYAERLFYVSGPHPMVNDIRTALGELGVHGSHIRTDFFPGYS